MQIEMLNVALMNLSDVSQAYRQKIEAELSDVCNDILSVLDDHLIPAAQAGESKVRQKASPLDFGRRAQLISAPPGTARRSSTTR